MIEFSTLSTKKRVALISGFLLSAFLIGGFVGYMRGAFGDDGSTERAINWTVKTGLWVILLVPVSAIFGKIQTFLESYLKLPFLDSPASFASFGIMMGMVFAIMGGISAILGIQSGGFWFRVLDGFTTGVPSGILGGILIKKFPPQVK